MNRTTFFADNLCYWTEEAVDEEITAGTTKKVLEAKICKRCRGNLVYKGDGFYVCESCGTLHREEEA